METRRFIVVISCITAIFTAIMVVYNFSVQPPFGSAVAAAANGSSRADFDSLFASDSARVPAASSGRLSESVSGSAPAGRETEPAGESSSTGSGKTSYSQKDLPDSPVDINTATLEQLETLPGIGESRAKSILDYRNRHGGFKSINELDNVEGIGSGIIRKITPYVTLK